MGECRSDDSICKVGGNDEYIRIGDTKETGNFCGGIFMMVRMI
jgi:hypothetical protein